MSQNWLRIIREVWWCYSSLLRFRGIRETIQKILNFGNLVKIEIRIRVVRRLVLKRVNVTRLELERQNWGIRQSY